LINLDISGTIYREWLNDPFDDIVGISNDGRFIADVSDDGRTLSVYSVDADAEIHNIHTHIWFSAFAFSPNGKLFLVATGNHIRVRSMDTGKLVTTVDISDVGRIVVSNDASFFIARSTFAPLVYVFDTASGRVLTSFSCRGMGALTISPDDLFITTASHIGS
jgi:WD40 repeat protein